MIHSLSGGRITEYETLLYCKVVTDFDGAPKWYISPFPAIKAGDRVLVPCGGGSSEEGVVERVDAVTAQTAPYPVKRTREIEKIL